jgi:hypothetical protein
MIIVRNEALHLLVFKMETVATVVTTMAVMVELLMINVVQDAQPIADKLAVALGEILY